MTLADFQQLLNDHPQHLLQASLPGGDSVPQCFHITEVARVDRHFIDCGGTERRRITCQLQLWVGPDEDHRITAAKAASILRKGAHLLPDAEAEVEMEYEAGLISQYPVSGVSITPQTIVFELGLRHTACLAPELCGLPALLDLKKPGQPCCAPGCC
jgi:hypothetical protein